MYGWEKGWEWLTKLAANTGIFTARSRDVPSVVAKGEFAVGVAVPSYMAFAEVLGGYDVMFVYPKNAYVTPEPMAVLKGAPHPKAAHAFIEFCLTEEGQLLLSGLGVYPITPKYKVQGPAGSNPEKAVPVHGRHPLLLRHRGRQRLRRQGRRREEAHRGRELLLPQGDRREAQGHRKITRSPRTQGKPIRPPACAPIGLPLR